MMVGPSTEDARDAAAAADAKLRADLTEYVTLNRTALAHLRVLGVPVPAGVVEALASTFADLDELLRGEKLKVHAVEVTVRDGRANVN